MGSPKLPFAVYTAGGVIGVTALNSDKSTVTITEVTDTRSPETPDSERIPVMYFPIASVMSRLMRRGRPLLLSSHMEIGASGNTVPSGILAKSLPPESESASVSLSPGKEPS